MRDDTLDLLPIYFPYHPDRHNSPEKKQWPYNIALNMFQSWGMLMNQNTTPVCPINVFAFVWG